MSDYTQITDFSAKDSLPTGNPSKLVKGSEHDAEYAAISTAIATKYDSDDIASVAQAQAETLDTVLITPSKLGSWSDSNAGIVGDLHALADPNADRIIFWDDSASAAAFLTVSTGLSLSATSLTLSHLGLEALVDPNADRVAFWDDSAGAFAWLSVSTGLTLSGTTLTTNDSAIVHDSLSGFVADEHVAHSGVTLTAGTGLSGGGTIAASRTFDLDISGLTSMTVAPDGADSFLYNDGGTMKQMTYEQAALPTNSVTASRNFASSDVGHVVRVTSGTVTLTMPSGVGQDNCPIIVVNSTANDVTLASGTATIDSANSLLTIPAGGMATLIRESSTLWHAGGSLQ